MGHHSTIIAADAAPALFKTTRTRSADMPGDEPEQAVGKASMSAFDAFSKRVSEFRERERAAG